MPFELVGSPGTRDLEEALLSVDGVYSVQIAGSPDPSVEALYVRADRGRNIQRIVADVRATAKAEAGIDIAAAHIHVMGVPPERLPATRRIRAIVTTARPRQWTKNILVFGAPATGGVLFEPGVLSSAVAAFVSFSLVASGIYFMNDVVDVKADLQHPTKRLRPIASGLLSLRLAVALGSIFVAAGLVVGLWGGGAPLARGPGRIRGVVRRLHLRPSEHRLAGYRGDRRWILAASRGRRRGHGRPPLHVVPHRGRVRLAVPCGGQATCRVRAAR